MKTPLLSTAALCLAGWLTGCQQATDVEPQSLSRTVAGTYITNAYVNPLFAALHADQMPQLTVKPETDSTVTLIYRQFSPAKATQQLTQVLLQRQGEVLTLKQSGTLIGSWQWDRVFTSNGMETQMNVLQLAKQVSQDSSVSFTGYRD